MNTTQTFSRLSTTKLGQNRGRARVYLQGKWIARAGFAAGASIVAEFQDGRVILRLDADGDRHVSAKSGGAVPVIDVNTDQLRAALGAVEELQVKATDGVIVITPSRTAAKRAARVRNGLEGSMFSGGGFLSQAARQAGYTPAFAVEWDERYAEIFERNHPEAKVFNMSVHDVPVEELPAVELLTFGVPCEPFSTKRRNTKDGLPMEAHALGDMTFWALRIVDAVNPYRGVVEEVPGYLQSGAYWILRHALERMGYVVDARVIDPRDFGALTGRKRAVVQFTTDATVVWPEPAGERGTLGDILDVDADDWFDRSTKGWLFTHWDRQTAKGNNFASQRVCAASQSVGTISKRYFAGQGDAPVLAHPTKPETFRWFTVDEVKRLHGIPTGYYLGEAKTVAGEIMGQGVVVSTFEAIIRAGS
jgi:DNA (cytosine-5)-methyltransferase 1